jgi:hypothetical protein
MRAHIDSSATAAKRIAEWARSAGENNGATWDTRGATDTSAGHFDANARTDVWQRLLDRYLQGWAEANPTKIFFATTKGYRFNDPLVGRFSRWSIPLYFEHLRGRFSRSGQTSARDLALILSGPIDGPPRPGQVRFFREAPRLGLTGISLITIGEQGIIAESVVYDPNLALEVLRECPAISDSRDHA